MFRELLAAEFAPYGRLSDEQLDRLQQHYALLIQWNQKINLTRIDSVEDAVRFHYCESLFLAREIPAGAMSMVDVGSGAGFPGIPVAIFRPECTVCLMESHQRKAVFLREASRDLPNVQVIAMRAEECTERFDWMISRAVRLEDLLLLKIAPRLALLLGAEDAQTLPVGFHRIQTPWGGNRILAMT